MITFFDEYNDKIKYLNELKVCDYEKEIVNMFYVTSNKSKNINKIIKLFEKCQKIVNNENKLIISITIAKAFDNEKDLEKLNIYYHQLILNTSFDVDEKIGTSIDIILTFISNIKNFDIFTQKYTKYLIIRLTNDSSNKSIEREKVFIVS